MTLTLRHITRILDLRRLARLAVKPLCALLSLLLLCGPLLTSCRIEPPLKLAEELNVTMAFGEVITDIDVIWDSDGSWRDRWWYGWDADDVRRWGEIAYPMPSNYEARFYYFGKLPQYDSWQDLQRLTVYEQSLRRRFDFGYHNMLIWSNIDSPDGTQVLVIDESDMAAIVATTTRSRLSYAMPHSRGTAVHNNPEIFYSGGNDGIYISENFEDYDYYDEVAEAWVKQLYTTLYPLVYIYLVQVVVYNNHGRITALSDLPAISNFADAVSLSTGHTSDNPVAMTYEMGFKKGRPARDGRPADIFGGKLTAFGLCDMEPWRMSRAPEYRGSRSELPNHLSLLMHFNNNSDSAYHYNVTEQVRRQAHGGVITIEIDADTLKIPNTVDMGGMFDPTIVPVDSVEYVFPM